MNNPFKPNVVNCYIEYRKGVFCQQCYNEDMKIVYITQDSFGVTKEVGKNCAKSLTGQIALIDELYSKMRSLDGKRKRFGDHRSSRSWHVPIGGASWKNAKGFLLRWKINYFGYDLQINETKLGSYILRVNDEIVLNGTNKPLYFKTMEDAKMYFFDTCGRMQLNGILRKHGVFWV